MSNEFRVRDMTDVMELEATLNRIVATLASVENALRRIRAQAHEAAPELAELVRWELEQRGLTAGQGPTG